MRLLFVGPLQEWTLPAEISAGVLQLDVLASGPACKDLCLSKKDRNIGRSCLIASQGAQVYSQIFCRM